MLQELDQLIKDLKYQIRLNLDQDRHAAAQFLRRILEAMQEFRDIRARMDDLLYTHRLD